MDTRPYLVLSEVPKLQEFLGRLKIPSNLQTQQLEKFISDLWVAKQGQAVPTPNWLEGHNANAIASIVMEYREKLDRQGQDVQIKKVAEIRGSRYNTGKPRMDLLDPIAVHGLVAVLTKGAEKYTAHNWRQGLPYMEIIASMQRHIFAIAAGEDVDPETGLQHADHIQCNAMFLSNMMKTRPDMDDRWKPPGVDAS